MDRGVSKAQLFIFTEGVLELSKKQERSVHDTCLTKRSTKLVHCYKASVQEAFRSPSDPIRPQMWLHTGRVALASGHGCGGSAAVASAAAELPSEPLPSDPVVRLILRTRACEIGTPPDTS